MLPVFCRGRCVCVYVCVVTGVCIYSTLVINSSAALIPQEETEALSVSG